MRPADRSRSPSSYDVGFPAEERYLQVAIALHIMRRPSSRGQGGKGLQHVAEFEAIAQNLLSHEEGPFWVERVAEVRLGSCVTNAPSAYNGAELYER